MLDSIYKSVEDTFLKFNFRKLSFLLTIFLLFIGGLYLFEHHTGHFHLNQIKKETEILKNLKELEEKGILNSDKLKASYLKIIERINNHNIKRVPLKINLHPIFKFLTGTWLLLMIFVSSLFSLAKGEPDGKNILLGSIFFIIIAGAVAVALPTIWKPWINYIFNFSINILVFTYFYVKASKDT